MNTEQNAFGLLLNYLWIAIAIVGAALGAPAMAFYLLGIKVVYAVIVAIIIDKWRKTDVALVETSKTRWNINVNGIPVSETTNSLCNLHFKSERELRTAYLKLLLPKIVMTYGLMVLSIIDVINSLDVLDQSPSHGISFLVSAYMLNKTINVTRLLSRLNSAKWYLHSTSFGTYTYYSAYTDKQDTMEPYLEKVFE